jgi:hypothetical protein
VPDENPKAALSEAADMAQQFQRLQRVLAESDSGIEDDASVIDPGRGPGRGPVVEPFLDLIDGAATGVECLAWIGGQPEIVHGDEVGIAVGREIADGLEAVTAWHDGCHAESMALFKALTPEQWSGKALTVAGTPITAWKWARAMVEHEAHHRGQIYMTLGMLGIATPPLYGLAEEEVAERSRTAAQAP